MKPVRLNSSERIRLIGQVVTWRADSGPAYHLMYFAAKSAA